MCPQVGPTFPLNFFIFCAPDFTLKRFVFEIFYLRNTQTTKIFKKLEMVRCLKQDFMYFW